VVVGIAVVAASAVVGLNLLRGESTHLVEYGISWSGATSEEACRDSGGPVAVTVSDGTGRIVGSAPGIRGKWDGARCSASTSITVFDADMYSFRRTWTNFESREDKESVDTISKSDLESKGWAF
jgi:hypothetical protein